MERKTPIRKYINKGEGIISILEIVRENEIMQSQEESDVGDLARIIRNFAKNKEYNSIHDIFKEEYKKRYNVYDSARPIGLPIDIMQEYRKEIMNSNNLNNDTYHSYEVRYILKEKERNDKENILKVVDENFNRDSSNEYIEAISSFAKNDSIIDRLNIVEGYFVLSFNDLDIGEKLTLYLTTEKLIQLMGYCRELIQLDKSETNFAYYIMNMYENECDADLLLFLNLIAHIDNKELRRTYYEALSGTIKVTTSSFSELKHLSTINMNSSYVIGYKHLDKELVTENLSDYGEYNAQYTLRKSSRWDGQREYFCDESKNFKKMIICLGKEYDKDLINHFNVTERTLMHKDIKKYAKNHSTQEMVRLIPEVFKEGTTDEEIVANYIKVITKASASNMDSKNTKKLDLF